jgi:hypothetical protein
LVAEGVGASLSRAGRERNAIGWVRYAASVPDQNSASCASARRTLRMMRGVIDRMI